MDTHSTSSTSRRGLAQRLAWYGLGALLTWLAAGCGQSTGDLVVTYLESGSPKAATRVTIVLGQENFDRNLFDFESNTNAAGEAAFRELVPGTYFYSVSGEGPTGLFDLIEGSTEVKEDQEARVVVNGGRPST